MKRIESHELYCAETDLGPYRVIIVSGRTLLDGIFFDSGRTSSRYLKNRSREIVPPVAAALDFFGKYLDGREAAVPPLDFSSFTLNERKVYATLMRLPAGKTISYGELAREAGFPRAARFVGSTMRKNRFPVIIPCHRVLPADGSLGNYTAGAGTAVKQWLLDFERGR